MMFLWIHNKLSYWIDVWLATNNQGEGPCKIVRPSILMFQKERDGLMALPLAVDGVDGLQLY
jgi:hypothetical protein